MDHDAPTPAETADPVDLTDPEVRRALAEQAPDGPPDRRGDQAYPYLLAALTFLVTPYLAGAFLPPRSATLAILILIPVASFFLGLLDGAIFRTSLAFSVTVTVLCWVATQLYFNDGAWVYAVLAGLCCALGDVLGARLGRRA